MRRGKKREREEGKRRSEEEEKEKEGGKERVGRRGRRHAPNQDEGGVRGAKVNSLNPIKPKRILGQPCPPSEFKR